MVETTLYKEFLILLVPTLKEHADNLFHITQQNSLKRTCGSTPQAISLGSIKVGKSKQHSMN